MSDIRGLGAGGGTSAQSGRRWFMVAPAGLVALSIFAFYFIVRTTLLGMQLEADRSAPAEAVATIQRVLFGSAMGGLFCGVMAAVALLCAGKAIWAVVFGAWVVTVVGAVWLIGGIVSGMTPAEVIFLIPQFPIMAMVIAASMLFMARITSGITAPLARTFNLVASLISAVETAGGSRWGRIWAVVAAIYVVVASSLMMHFFRPLLFWPF